MNILLDAFVNCAFGFMNELMLSKMHTLSNLEIQKKLINVAVKSKHN